MWHATAWGRGSMWHTTAWGRGSMLQPAVVRRHSIGEGWGQGVLEGMLQPGAGVACLHCVLGRGEGRVCSDGGTTPACPMRTLMGGYTLKGRGQSR